jgi:outer membrane protein OmpA-like peptidoglycan-associated protein
MLFKIFIKLFGCNYLIMNIKSVLVILIAFLCQIVLGQPESYIVKKASFSTDKNDEFSPVYYKEWIVLCSNRNSSNVTGYYDKQNKGLFKIYYVDTANRERVPSPKLFSKNLKTRFNDGPVTFNGKGDTICYSRNLEVEGKFDEVSRSRNKLGLFYAVFDGKEWTKIRDLRINNEYYNVTTPSLSPDGKKLFFASDKPGGFGGSDIYYSQLKDGYWSDPINLGPLINTKGNESYPFVNYAGEIFFSSDGHPGLGGKDIFFSRFSDSAWVAPIHIDAPINSPYDDFGIITDTLMKEGYFSSNREKSLDIFKFKTNLPQVFYNSIQKENQYCFIFSDIGSIVVDTTNLQYKWSFGNKETSKGAIVKHCFAGPGNYSVRLDIVERGTGKLFFTKLMYELELRDFEQPYINSENVAGTGESVVFDGLKSFLPGYNILSYTWDFGDGNRSDGKEVIHSFIKEGEYVVNLGLILKSKSTGIIHKTGISKKIFVFTNNQERASYLSKITNVKNSPTDIRKYKNALIKPQYSAETEVQQDAVYIVEFLSSKNKVEFSSSTLANVPKKYTIKEIFDADKNTYRYIVDQQMTLMATYPAFREMASLGFKDVQIKVYVLKALAEKELHNLIKINGAFADSYFDESNKLTSNAFIMLDQIVKLMNKYPSLKLEVAVHSDTSIPADASLQLSQVRSRLLVNYLINRGVNPKRLVATGFGSSKPIASNFVEKDRKLNRRIDFIILN